MFVLSMLFAAVILLLIYAVTRDTGKNTKYARKGGNAVTRDLPSSHPVATGKTAAKAG